jgi:dTDP-4-amino-4,6-dideoxygalactose transaminase
MEPGAAVVRTIPLEEYVQATIISEFAPAAGEMSAVERMLEVQAIIGRIQLRRLAEWHERRKANARVLTDALLQFPGAVRVPQPLQGYEHAFYRLYAYVKPDGLAAGWERDRIIAELSSRGLPTFQGSCSEVYLEKAFEGTRFRPLQRLPAAMELGETSLAFLTHPSLTDEDLETARNAIAAVFAEAAA